MILRALLVLVPTMILLCTYLTWRIFSRKRAEQQILPLLPPPDSLCWKSFPPQHPFPEPQPLSIETSNVKHTASSADQARKSAPFSLPLDIGNLFPGAIDGSLVGLSTFHSFMSIDPDVLHAVTASTAERLTNLHSIDTYINEHFFSAGSLSADGFFERLTGYVTEQKAAAALEALGHKVQFAAIPNQADWDLLVDGHAVQIKEGMSGIKDFLADHHLIPIYTGFENADALHNPLVHALHGLNSGAVHHATYESLGGLHDGFHAGFLHIPIATVLFSTFREVVILQQQHTTVQTALTNVALDAAGVCVGAMVGTKVGAVLGSFVPGPGTAIGAFVGALAGGIGGKLMSTTYRLSAFTAARQDYDAAVSYSTVTIKSVHETTAQQIRSIQGTSRAAFRKKQAQLVGTAEGEFAIISAQYESDYVLRISSVYGEIDQLLRADHLKVMTGLGTERFINRFLPRFRDHFRRMAEQWFEHSFKCLENEKADFQMALNRGTKDAAGAAEGFYGRYRFHSPRSASLVSDLTTELRRREKECDLVRERLEAKIELIVEQSRKSSAREIEDIYTRVSIVISGLKAKIQDAHLKLVTEGKPVGIAIPTLFMES